MRIAAALLPVANTSTSCMRNNQTMGAYDEGEEIKISTSNRRTTMDLPTLQAIAAVATIIGTVIAFVMLLKTFKIL
jgi:hypothetical protein